MDGIIETIKNFKIDIPKNSYRKKIDSIKARNKVVSRKIKYLSYDKEGNFVEKRGSFLDKNKNKLKLMNKGPIYRQPTDLEELIRLLPKSPTLKVKICKTDYTLNKDTNRCVKIKTCKTGYTLNKDTNRCVKIKKCKPNQILNEKSGKCVKKCKLGFILNEETGRCKKLVK